MATEVSSTAFQAGNVIGFHGARYVMRDQFKVHDHKLISDGYNMIRPVYTNIGERIDDGSADMPRLWNFQGNDLARWFVEPV
jgi:hypothetical protein